MPFGWDDALVAAIVVSDFIYHRWFQDTPPIAPPEKVTLPTLQPGDIVPLLWGRYRVNKPLVAWTSPPASVLASDVAFLTSGAVSSGYFYMLDQLFNVCIGFDGGQHRLKEIWIADTPIGQHGDPTNHGLTVLNGDGTGGDPFPFAGAMFVSNSFLSVPAELAEGYVEFLNGAPTQTLQSGGSDTRWAGGGMIAAGVTPDEIPGFRGYLSVYLFNRSDAPINHWIYGTSSSLPAFSFEMSSYAAPEKSFYFPIADFYGGGTDENPINVLYDVLTGRFGKLRMDPARIDTVSFTAAAKTCYDDGIGYSIAYEAPTPAHDIISDILRQIDGIIYEDPKDGKIHIKLVRADYNPLSVRELRGDMGISKIENFAASGWTGLPNKITVSFSDRSRSYVTNTVSGMGDANAAALQDTEVSEQLIAFAGCCTAAMAQIIADRELQALCRPIAKFDAIGDQRWADVNPGDVLAVTWPKLQMSRAMFRVAAVNRGAASDGSVRLSLIQEYFQVYRGMVSPYGPIPSFPHSPGL